MIQHLRPGERKKNKINGEKINSNQRNVLKTRHCKLFCPAQLPIGIRMCTSTLSGWKQHPLQSLCYCSLRPEIKRDRIPTEECREHQKDGEVGGHLTSAWGSSRGNTCDSAFSKSTLMKPYRILGESRDLGNTISSPPAAAKAYCFLLWMFGSKPVLIWYLEFTTAHLLVLFPQIILSSPNRLFPALTHPTDCL